MVQVNHLKVSFGEESIYKDLSFSVRQGEKLVITGESGVGKSTLLKVLAGFVTTYQGTVIIDDVVLNAENVHTIRHKMAWLPQDISLQVDTVYDLFFEPFELKVNQKNRPKQKEIKQTFEAFSLPESLLDKKVDQISGGQKQRIILASCLLLKKPLLLIDEPTSALDQSIKKNVTDYVLSQKGLTVIAVTHDAYWTEQSDNILNLK